MALREEMQKQGQWLFRWRSYLPLVFVPFMLIAAARSAQFQTVFGNTVDRIIVIASLTISFLGLAIRCLTIGYTPKRTSGRNTRKQIADTLNTKAIYSVVRHPLYFGNFVTYLGILIFLRVWWVVLLGGMAFWIYYERIMYNEEEFLRGKFRDEYLKWSETTPAFFPRLRNWKNPRLRFSLRNVLKREYSGFFAIVVSFTFLELIINLFEYRKIVLGQNWIVFFLTGLLIYLTLRTLKKKTRLFDVAGR